MKKMFLFMVVAMMSVCFSQSLYLKTDQGDKKMTNENTAYDYNSITIGLPNQFLQPSGTASSPTYSFAASTGTGMYLNASNILAFTTAGSDRVTIDAAGRTNVGALSQTSSMFSVKNATGEVNIALFTNEDGTTKALVDSTGLGDFYKLKIGLGATGTARATIDSIIVNDSLRIYLSNGKQAATRIW